MNQDRNTMAEERCPMCPNHCSADAPRCGRGRAYFAGKDGDTGSEEYVSRQQEEGEEHGYHHGGSDHFRGGCDGHGWHGGHDGHGGCRHPHDDGFRHACAPEDTLYGLMRQAGHYLFHRARGNEAHGQERILRILSKAGGMSQKELQCMLGIQPGSVSEILNKMEEKGLIARTRSSEDARRVDLVLTDQGKEKAAAAEKDDTEELFGVLTAEEQQLLKRLMTKLVSSWLKDPEEEA